LNFSFKHRSALQEHSHFDSGVGFVTVLKSWQLSINLHCLSHESDGLMICMNVSLTSGHMQRQLLSTPALPAGHAKATASKHLQEQDVVSNISPDFEQDSSFKHFPQVSQPGAVGRPFPSHFLFCSCVHKQRQFSSSVPLHASFGLHCVVHSGKFDPGVSMINPASGS
jgi:hypothetical protein